MGTPNGYGSVASPASQAAFLVDHVGNRDVGQLLNVSLPFLALGAWRCGNESFPREWGMPSPRNFFAVPLAKNVYVCILVRIEAPLVRATIWKRAPLFAQGAACRATVLAPRF